MRTRLGSSRSLRIFIYNMAFYSSREGYPPNYSLSGGKALPRPFDSFPGKLLRGQGHVFSKVPKTFRA